jgi:hypothetical protein
MDKISTQFTRLIISIKVMKVYHMKPALSTPRQAQELPKSWLGVDHEAGVRMGQGKGLRVILRIGVVDV